MADLTELRERVEDCRASLAFRAGDMAGEPAKYTVALDALLTAHRALCLAEAREAVEGVTDIAGSWRHIRKNDTLAAIDALQEGT